MTKSSCLAECSVAARGDSVVGCVATCNNASKQASKDQGGKTMLLLPLRLVL